MHGLRELYYPYGCHWSDEFQKPGPLSENRAPGNLQTVVAIHTVLLTLQTLPWLQHGL